uniref:Uncharacterized protein n=1 Tax=Oryza brachyantha TaxID=4533 RepID=J3LTJ9_ORYBR
MRLFVINILKVSSEGQQRLCRRSDLNSQIDVIIWEQLEPKWVKFTRRRETHTVFYSFATENFTVPHMSVRQRAANKEIR